MMVSDDDLAEQHDELIERFTTVQHNLASLREDYRLEARKRDKRILFTQIAIACAIAVALLAGIVGAFAIQTTRQANKDRAQRTIAACLQSNEQQRTQAQAEKDEERARQAESSQALDRLLKLLQITPAELAALQAAHLRKFDATVDHAHRLRDCSPAGIKAYYEPNGAR
jgi:cytoskeletal protein RodZ